MTTTYIDSLLRFMDNSPCNFLAVETMKKMLLDNGFVEKKLSEKLCAQAGEKFFFTKNDSAIFAVTVGQKPIKETGFKIVAAHSDSPCFRIKPNAPIKCDGGIVKLNTEVYGGPILYTWFDRPLSIAGRVIIKGDDALHVVSRTIMIKRPLMQISHLAIHFNRAVNEGNPLSKQKDMLPIIAKVNSEFETGNMLINLVAQELGVVASDILDFDLLLYDTTPACTFGLNNEFISSGRLDDLSMAHAAITAICESTDEENTCIAAIFDNEETGSGTKQGAGSPVLANALQRMAESQGCNYDDYCVALQKTFMISADNAHAHHPNYNEKYDPTNHPAMGGGPCIKINANCKYMSDAHSVAIFKNLCDEAGSPCQYFINHSDVAGGSTLGNILTGQIDIEGVDVGNPLLAMHSVRETASVDDHINMIKVFKTFFS